MFFKKIWEDVREWVQQADRKTIALGVVIFLVSALLLGTMMLPGDILLMSNYSTVSHMGLLNSVPGLYLAMCIGDSVFSVVSNDSSPFTRKGIDDFGQCSHLALAGGFF